MFFSNQLRKEKAGKTTKNCPGIPKALFSKRFSK